MKIPSRLIKKTLHILKYYLALNFFKKSSQYEYIFQKIQFIVQSF